MLSVWKQTHWTCKSSDIDRFRSVVGASLFHIISKRNRRGKPVFWHTFCSVLSLPNQENI